MEGRAHCRDVYKGGCGMFIGPPHWRHRTKKHMGPDLEHPTKQQALVAAEGPNTPPDVLSALAAWDDQEVSAAARANPNFAPAAKA